MVLCLVVDDNYLNRFVLTSLLEKKMGFKVIELDDGDVAVKNVKNNVYDIIFMDLSMPHDGVQACQNIRKFNKKVPIVAVTAHIDMKTISTVMKSGFSDIIWKPFTKNDLELTVRKYL